MLSIQSNPRVTFKTHFHDKDMLVVEKPAHRVTLPGKGHVNDTLLNGLFEHYGVRLQKLGKSREFGIVHRLDRDTSGLLLVALSIEAYDGLLAAFRKREISKYYWAVCSKAPKKASGVIKLPIVETKPVRGKPRTVHIARVGKAAVTAFRVLEESDVAALIEARPVTGRLHQVRIHLDAIGSPILGDEFYGPKSMTGASPRLALHAHRLIFQHPCTGERVDIKTAWPNELRRLLKAMRLTRPDLKKADGPDAGAEST